MPGIPLRNRHIAQDQKGFADTVMKAELASRLVFLHGYVKAFRDLSKAAQHLTETMLVPFYLSLGKAYMIAMCTQLVGTYMNWAIGTGQNVAQSSPTLLPEIV